MPPEIKKAEGNEPDPNENVAPTSLDIEIDGENKNYTKEAIVNMVKQQASATKKNQELAPVLKSIEKFSTDPERYTTEAEASFSIIHDLQQKGILDDNGELITKTEGDPDPDPVQNFQRGPDSSKANTEEVIAKALVPLQEQMESMKKNQNSLLRVELDREIQKRHPELTKQMRDVIFDKTQRDTSKSIWDHAIAESKTQATRNAESRETHAKEFGINLEEFDENKLNQQDQTGGGLAMFTGKKISFKRGKDSLTPKQAMIRDFKQNPL